MGVWKDYLRWERTRIPENLTCKSCGSSFNDSEITSEEYVTADKKEIVCPHCGKRSGNFS